MNFKMLEGRRWTVRITAAMVGALAAVTTALTSLIVALPPEDPEDRTNLATAPPCEELSQLLEVRRTNSEHKWFQKNTVAYRLTFPARDGYSVVDYEWEDRSENHLRNLVVNGLGGTELIVEFDLTAGHTLNKERGWLHGTIRTIEVPNGCERDWRGLTGASAETATIG